jgi:NADH-quinone oxidoreductase subunit L
MTDFGYCILIPLIPLLMFLLLGLAGNKLKAKLSGLLGTTGLAVVAVLSYITAYKYFFVAEKMAGAFPKITAFDMVWLQLSEKLHIQFRL